MAEPTQKELMEMILAIRQELNRLEESVLKVVPEKEWYLRTEFAQKAGLSAQTVSNYLSRGKFGDNQRKKNGRWEIHRSELKD